MIHQGLLLGFYPSQPERIVNCGADWNLERHYILTMPRNLPFSTWQVLASVVVGPSTSDVGLWHPMYLQVQVWASDHMHNRLEVACRSIP